MIKGSIITINNHHIFILVIFGLFLISCSSSEEIGKDKENEDEIYIFDEVPPEDSYTFEKPTNNVNLIYVIQVGAFSTRERAELFAGKSRRDLNREELNFLPGKAEEILTVE